MNDPAAFNFDGQYGEDYEALAERVLPGYGHLFSVTLAFFERWLDDDAHVLVVGSGPAREIATFGPRNPRWRFTAVDPSRPMLDLTEAVVGRLEMTHRVRTIHGYVHERPPDERYDAATIFNVLHFLDDDGGKEKLIRSVADRLHEGAPLALFDLHGDRQSAEWDLLFRTWIRFMDIRGMPGDEQTAFIQRLLSGIVYVPESRILEICADAGLVLRTRYLTGLQYGGWMFERRG